MVKLWTEFDSDFLWYSHPLKVLARSSDYVNFYCIEPRDTIGSLHTQLINHYYKVGGTVYYGLTISSLHTSIAWVYIVFSYKTRPNSSRVKLYSVWLFLELELEYWTGILKWLKFEFQLE